MPEFTYEQLCAINSINKPVTVTAAAGSGKTAVMVERIMKYITDENNPVSIDKFLLVTFTNAAAAQLRSRISEKLTNEQKNNFRNNYLFKQSLLIYKSDICTVHSFCLDIVKKYFYLLDIPADIRLIEQAEADMEKQEVLDNLIEELYAEPSVCDGFLLLSKYFHNGRNDKALSKAILSLSYFPLLTASIN